MVWPSSADLNWRDAYDMVSLPHFGHRRSTIGPSDLLCADFSCCSSIYSLLVLNSTTYFTSSSSMISISTSYLQTWQARPPLFPNVGKMAPHCGQKLTSLSKMEWFSVTYEESGSIYRIFDLNRDIITTEDMPEFVIRKHVSKKEWNQADDKLQKSEKYRLLMSEKLMLISRML